MMKVFDSMTYDRPYHLFIGIPLILVSLFFMIVSFNQPHLYMIQLGLGLDFLFAGITNRDNVQDERTDIVMNKSFKATYIITIFIGFIFFTLYFFNLISLDPAKAFITFIGLMNVTHAVSKFVIERKM